uniref:hypothetical protein n=1 Tax=Nonomuraea sp. CA-251285 TaxID=3240002 RepID=UPI003F493D13
MKTKGRNAQAAEDRRVQRLRRRELRRRIANMLAANASPEQIAHVQRIHHMEEETRAVLGGSNRVRRTYRAPFVPRDTAQNAGMRLLEGCEPFDDGFPSCEQLPRAMEVRFLSLPGTAGPVTQMLVNGRAAGRPLGDHGREPGHRWQYALNVAFATCLGWSPVLRALLGAERLSDPHTANVEDGQHARQVEEQVAWAIFVDARAHGWHARGPRLALVRQVRAMVADFEVSACTEEEWRQAIITGVRCLRHVWAADGGVLHADGVLGTVEVARCPVTAQVAVSA